MPAPLAKGIIVTVSVLVAAGVAVYQSPQFQQWMTTSRRKIALALHNLGDEIHPHGSASPVREDISMTEEIGQDAEERRRIAGAEIMRRAAILESRRSEQGSRRPLNSFDALVDGDGKLRTPGNETKRGLTEDAVGSSTGVEVDTPGLLRRGGKVYDLGVSVSNGDRLRLDVPSETTSRRSSQSLFTPDSEPRDGDTLFDPFSASPIRGQTSVSPSSTSSHTEDNQSIYYAHPHSVSDSTQQPGALASLDDSSRGDQLQHEVSSASSTTASYAHIDESFDSLSDGTLSEPGAPSVGIATPASWSEVGSVISNDDAGHLNLL